MGNSILTIKLTNSELVDGRDWLLDCCATSEGADFIKDCTDSEIEILVSKKFENGLQGFIDSYGPNYKREI